MIDEREHIVCWLEQDVEDTPPGYEWLGDRERDNLSRYRFTRRRNDWRLGRWTAKLAIATRLGAELDVSDVEVVPAADGAPETFIRGERSPLRLSISHSGGRSFCVVAPDRVLVGGDVETIEDRGSMFAHDYFVPSEVDLVRTASREMRALVETLIWSAKESALKALRDGLRRDTRDVIVDVGGLAGALEWNPLAVSVVDGTSAMFGWWRHAHGRIYTVVTCRPCRAPEELHPEPLPA